MSLLSPLFLLGALAAAIPVALHFLKRHPEALVRFSAVRLLRAAPTEHASRRRLRELLLLALRVAALMLCALAFARPFFADASAADGRALVIAIDTSFSMSGAGRFDQARALAMEAIERAPPNTAVGVVTFDDTARVVSALSSDRALARASVTGVQPTAGATRYRAAIAVASDVLGLRPGAIVVVTDLQATGWDAADRVSLPATVELRVADIGAGAGNIAVTSARVAGDRLSAVIRNVSPAPADVRVRVEAGSTADAASSKPAGELRVAIEAGSSVEVAFPRPPGRWASIGVEDPTGAAADNTRYVLLGEDVKPRVLVISATGDLSHDAFYLAQALSASNAGESAPYEVVGVAASALQGWDEARVDANAAVVLVSTRALEHHGRELIRHFVEQGGGLFVAAGADVEGDVLSEALGVAGVSVIPPASQSRSTRRLAPTDSRHPVLRAFSGQASLGLVKFDEVPAIRAEGCLPLARFTTGETALFECESGRGRALLLASDLDNRANDFPRHATFLPFVHEVIRYLVGDRRVSEYLVSDVPSGIPPRPGIAAARNPGRSAELVIVNTDSAESESARLSEQAFAGAVVRSNAPRSVPRTMAREREAAQHLWQYLLGLVLVVLAVEGVVAMRTA